MASGKFSNQLITSLLRAFRPRISQRSNSVLMIRNTILFKNNREITPLVFLSSTKAFYAAKTEQNSERDAVGKSNVRASK